MARLAILNFRLGPGSAIGAKLDPGGKPRALPVFSSLASCGQCCGLSSPQSGAILSCSLSKASPYALSRAASEEQYFEYV